MHKCRAKKLLEEEYIVGYYVCIKGRHYIFTGETNPHNLPISYEIDINTLSSMDLVFIGEAQYRLIKSHDNFEFYERRIDEKSSVDFLFYTEDKCLDLETNCKLDGENIINQLSLDKNDLRFIVEKVKELDLFKED